MTGGLPVVRKVQGRVSVPTRGTDRQYLPHAEELLKTPPRKRSILMIWGMCSLLFGAIAWACFAQLDIYAVANGRVQYVGLSKIVQPVDTGKIRSILVQNGTKVSAGQTVVELDTTEIVAALAAAEHDVQSVDAEIARHAVEIEAAEKGTACCPSIAFPPDVDRPTREIEESLLVADLAQLAAETNSISAQIMTQSATRQRLQASISSEERFLDFTKQRLELKSSLLRAGAGTTAAMLDAQEQVEQGAVRVAYDRGQVMETDAATAALKASIRQLSTKFIANHLQLLQDARLKKEEYKKNLVKTQSQLTDSKLVSPIEGTVQQLAVTSIGQVVFPGQSLMVVAPSGGPIEIEVYVPGQNIGFVEIGQEAMIKADPYPFAKYGTFSGSVARISRDAVDAKNDVPADASDVARNPNATSSTAVSSTQRLVFPVIIEVKNPTVQKDGKELSLRPGMTATVEVKTGTRSLIAYLLSPLSRAIESK